jgi:hypothetical protein
MSIPGFRSTLCNGPKNVSACGDLSLDRGAPEAQWAAFLEKWKNKFIFGCSKIIHLMLPL